MAFVLPRNGRPTAAGPSPFAGPTLESCSYVSAAHRDLLQALWRVGNPELFQPAIMQPVEEADMLEDRYLYAGLCALARAHRAGAMSGHLGAAAVAAWLFTHDFEGLPEETCRALAREVDRLEQGEETVWFDPVKTGLTVADFFEPFEPSPRLDNAPAVLVNELWRSVDRLRQSGHNVIFGALALRALRQRGEMAEAAIVQGLDRLLALFKDAGPGRGYYGRARGWLAGSVAPRAPEAEVPPYESPLEAARVALKLVAEHAHEHRRGFGGLFHIINHACALIDLEMLGYRDLARAGVAAHRDHVRLWLALPVLDAELGKLQRADADPLSPDYWRKYRSSVQWSGWLTHRLKTVYGFYRLLRHVEDDTLRAAALRGFGYLMA